MRRYEVIAHNTAVASENRIHDDEVARRFGFQGGLVPGVDVYAYLIHPVVEAWGKQWLTNGEADVRFTLPVYDGHLTIVESTDLSEDEARLRVLDDAGTECAVGTFTRSPTAGTSPPSADGWPVAALPDRRPDAAPDAFASYYEAGALPTLYLTLDDDTASGYLDDVRESLPLLRGDRAPAHPAWLLRRANDALTAAVRLGPWIHVGSSITHHAPVHVGDTVEVRSRVVKWWDAKGHRFVDLDVALIVDGDVGVRIEHTAIYRPRPRD